MQKLADYSVEDYLTWFLGNTGAIPLSVFGGVTFVGDFAELVLHREGPFQVQLCLCKPNAEIPDHGHPNVDTIVVYVTGQVYFRVEGKDGEMITVYEPQDVQPEHSEDPNVSVANKHGRVVRVEPSVKHGATIGPVGGAFLSVQKWLKGVPTSTERDWVGPALSPEHAEAIR